MLTQRAQKCSRGERLVRDGLQNHGFSTFRAISLDATPYENHPKSMFLALSLCLCETSEFSGFDGCGARVPLSLRNCANFGEILSRNLRVGLVSRLFRPGFARRQRDRDSEPVPELVKIGRFGRNARKSSMGTQGKSTEITVLQLCPSVFAKLVKFQVLTAAEHVSLCLCGTARILVKFCPEIFGSG